MVNGQYHIYDAEKIPIMMNWLEREVIQFTKTLNAAEQELCEIVKGLFNTLGDKFKP